MPNICIHDVTEKKQPKLILLNWMQIKYFIIRSFFHLLYIYIYIYIVHLRLRCREKCRQVLVRRPYSIRKYIDNFWSNWFPTQSSQTWSTIPFVSAANKKHTHAYVRSGVQCVGQFSRKYRKKKWTTSNDLQFVEKVKMKFPPRQCFSTSPRVRSSTSIINS